MIGLACAVFVRAAYERAMGRDPWAAYGPMAAGSLLMIGLGAILVVRWAYLALRRWRPGPRIARLRQWLSETPD